MAILKNEPVFESPVDSSHEEVTLFKNVKVYKDCLEGGYYYV